MRALILLTLFMLLSSLVVYGEQSAKEGFKQVHEGMKKVTRSVDKNAKKGFKTVHKQAKKDTKTIDRTAKKTWKKAGQDIKQVTKD